MGLSGPRIDRCLDRGAHLVAGLLEVVGLQQSPKYPWGRWGGNASPPFLACQSARIFWA